MGRPTREAITKAVESLFDCFTVTPCLSAQSMAALYLSGQVARLEKEKFELNKMLQANIEKYATTEAALRE